MKILRILSFTLIFIITVFLVLGNIFYNNLRKYLDRDYLSLELSDEILLGFEKASRSNADFLLYVTTDKKIYRKFEKIIVVAKLLRKADKSTVENGKIEVIFYKSSGEILKNIDGKNSIVLLYDKSAGVWKGVFFPLDFYYKGSVKFEVIGYPDTPESSLSVSYNFFIESAEPSCRIDKGMSFLGIYSLERVSKRNIVSLNGKEVDWNYLPEWLSILSFDGVLMLSGVTKSFEEDVSLTSPWDRNKVTESDLLAEKTVQRGKKFAGWIKALKVEGTYLKKIGYKPALIFDGNSFSEDSSTISMLDENRKKSLARLFSSFMQNKNYSFVGFSDIFLPKNTGVELYEEFLKDLQIPVLPQWDKLSGEEKLRFFLDKLKDKDFLFTFENWKKYYMASYLREIINEGGHSKAIFYFLNYSELKEFPELLKLIFDCGIDFVVVNFNESFLELIKNLDSIKNSDLNEFADRVIFSYNLDFKNLDVENYDVAAIENYFATYLLYIKEMSRKYNVAGFVINDLYNAMSGKRGPYSPLDWMYGLGRIVFEFKNINAQFPFLFYYYFPFEIQYDKEYKFFVRFENVSTFTLKDVNIDILDSEGNYFVKGFTLQEIPQGKVKEASFPVVISKKSEIFIKKKQILGIRLTWDEKTDKGNFKKSYLIFHTFRVASETN